MELNSAFKGLIYCVIIIDGPCICWESPEYGTNLYGYIKLQFSELCDTPATDGFIQYNFTYYTVTELSRKIHSLYMNML